MSSEFLSPSILRVVQSAAQAAEKATEAAQQVSSAAAERVAAEIHQFQTEAAKIDELRAENERSAAIQAAVAGGATPQPSPSEAT